MDSQTAGAAQPKIRDVLRDTRTVSFEFFPPRSEDNIPGVLRAINRLAEYNPDYISVTYGAGGSTRAFTEEIVTRAKNETDLVVMAHQTCVSQTKEAIHDVLERHANAGIRNVIALRGDPPQGQKDFVPVDGGFAHATDLIEHIKANFDFGIAGACYPEGHTESPNVMQDVKYARQKVDLGADFLITQLFFDNNDFYAFVDKARKAGINVPVIAGLLPVINAAQIRRFTSLCGSKIPPELDRQLDKVGDDDDAARELGIEYATRQVEDLWNNGVEGIHFYVLNRSYSVSKILENVGIANHTGATGE
jgi:methylenetetrahydrofolate reductase (NADPH)